jgi:hypothetical protein
MFGVILHDQENTWTRDTPGMDHRELIRHSSVHHAVHVSGQICLDPIGEMVRSQALLCILELQENVFDLSVSTALSTVEIFWE